MGSQHLDPNFPKEVGFIYDRSLMGNDIPYDVSMPQGPLTEIPVQWLAEIITGHYHVVPDLHKIRYKPTEKSDRC